MDGDDGQAEAGMFLLLQPGERDRDDAWPGKDLMEFFQLKRLYDFSMRALEKPSAYLKGVPGDTTLYRGEGTDIRVFADVLPLTQRPAVQPLPSRQVIEQALILRPGRTALPEADKGAVVKEHETAKQPQAGSKGPRKQQ